MPYTRTEPIIMEFEADEDGNLELVDCYDESGNRETHQPCGKSLTDMGWATEEWHVVGIDMLGSKQDYEYTKTLKIKGYMWCDGPDFNREYDGGFEIEEVLEDIPMAQAVPVEKNGKRLVFIEDCPNCHKQHTIKDNTYLTQNYVCNGKSMTSKIKETK